MEFDEYDYLEKTVENPDLSKVTENTNGDEGNVKHGDKEHEKRSKRKGDDRDGEKNEHRRSKRSRSKDGSRERDREKSRERRSRHRSRSRDGEKNRERGGKEIKDRDVDERNGKDKPREKDKERDHRGERRSQDRERERNRDHRSSSRSERHRIERYERDLPKTKERDPRERERDARKKKDDAEPEVDPERDQRTVFAYQIHLKADERDVYDFFSRAGKVRDVRLIMDRNSRRSKGVGYIEFYDVMSVPMAIALSGQPLLGQPVMVKPSEAEKNLVQSSAATGASGAAGPYSGGARRLYVGNLHVNITEDQLRQVFEAFGLVELVQLPLDETGHCKGFGFVQFSRLEDARNALSLNGQLELAGRTIKVSTVTDHSGVQETVPNPTDLDDDDGGLALNASTRALLIQRLARNDLPSGNSSTLPPSGALPGPPLISPPAPFAPLVPNSAPIGPNLPTSPGDVIGSPTECLILKNMFDPKLETEAEFDLDIKEDVQEECSKFGNLKHIFVDKNSTGLVYLRFENAQSATNAQRSLHGRWFAGKMITASFMDTQAYEAKFPECR